MVFPLTQQAKTRLSAIKPTSYQWTEKHKIKQPLTLLKLTSEAIRKELKKDEVTKEINLKKINFLENAVKEINEVLKQLQNIKNPVFSEYANDIKMIDVDSDNKQ